MEPINLHVDGAGTVSRWSRRPDHGDYAMVPRADYDALVRERYEAVARAERAEKALRDATTAERDRCAAPEGEVERLRREFYEAARERLRAYEAWQFSTEYDTGHLKTRFEEACDDEKVAYDALLAAEGAEKSPGDGA